MSSLEQQIAKTLDERFRNLIRLSIDLNRSISKNLSENGLALWVVLFLSLWLISGCLAGSAPTQSSSTLSAKPSLNAALASDLAANAGVAVPALIVAERTASATADLGVLSLLWHAEARIVDGRNTADRADDYIWPDRAAILDRYELAVFPNPPPLFEALPTFDLVQDEVSAMVVNGVDEWQFVYEENRWWIAELAYQRP
jgi:hypothetical protein